LRGICPGGLPKRTWSEVTECDLRTNGLQKDDACDCKKWRIADSDAGDGEDGTILGQLTWGNTRIVSIRWICAVKCVCSFLFLVDFCRV